MAHSNTNNIKNVTFIIGDYHRIDFDCYWDGQNNSSN